MNNQYPEFANPWAFGARGGGNDDTAAILKWINEAPDGSRLVLPCDTFGVQADALRWNKRGIEIVGAGPAKSLGILGGGYSVPTLKFLTSGEFGIKVGAKENYTTGGLLSGGGIKNIRLDFNTRKFTDAAMVLEGLTLYEIEGNNIGGAGSNVSGNRCRLLRARVWWDSWICKNYISQCHSDDGVIVFDDQFQDPNGNVNNLRWMENHFEPLTGTWFKSMPLSNVDMLKFAFNKCESGQLQNANAAASYVFDLDGCQSAQVVNNNLNLFGPNQVAGLFRIGATQASWHNKIKDNVYFAITTPVEIVNGIGGARTVCKDNEANNTNIPLTATNLAGLPWEYLPGRSALNAGTQKFGAFPTTDRANGWMTASRLNPQGSVTNYAPDPTSLSPEQIVYRRTDDISVGQVLLAIPFAGFRDYPVDVSVYVRAKRTVPATVASLQMTVKQQTLAALPLPDVAGWQVVRFDVDSSMLAGLGDGASDRWRIAYGPGNAQPIDIDAVLVLPR